MKSAEEWVHEISGDCATLEQIANLKLIKQIQLDAMNILEQSDAPTALAPAACYAPSHKALVKKAGAWLRNRKNCGVVMEELATQNNETPDALGFHGAGGSILVECKTSRADYLADKNKIFRRNEELGMGDKRYFAAPKGLIKPDELPEGWGLLEMTDGRTYETKQATYKAANKCAEVKMLMSAIRRLEISSAVFVRAEEPNAPHEPRGH